MKPSQLESIRLLGKCWMTRRNKATFRDVQGSLALGRCEEWETYWIRYLVNRYRNQIKHIQKQERRAPQTINKPCPECGTRELEKG